MSLVSSLTSIITICRPKYSTLLFVSIETGVVHFGCGSPRVVSTSFIFRYGIIVYDFPSKPFLVLLGDDTPNNDGTAPPNRSMCSSVFTERIAYFMPNAEPACLRVLLTFPTFSAAFLHAHSLLLSC